VDVGDNLDGTTGNLGRDVKGLEERGLSGLHTGVTGGDDDVDGGDGTGLSRGSDLVLDDNVTDLLEVTGGEDETDVALDEGKETLEVGVVGEDETDRAADHGVLTHEDLSLATENLTDLVHLVGSDIVDVDDNDRG
jgi:hypothetical protein